MSIDRDLELTTIGIDLKDMDDSALHSVSIWLDCGQGTRVSGRSLLGSG